MKTVKDLMNRAEVVIRNGEDLAYDVASEYSQMFGNVSHMTWFKKAVAMDLASNVAEYRHLDGVVR